MLRLKKCCYCISLRKGSIIFTVLGAIYSMISAMFNFHSYNKMMICREKGTCTPEDEAFPPTLAISAVIILWFNVIVDVVILVGLIKANYLLIIPSFVVDGIKALILAFEILYHIRQFFSTNIPVSLVLWYILLNVTIEVCLAYQALVIYSYYLTLLEASMDQ